MTVFLRSNPHSQIPKHGIKYYRIAQLVEYYTLYVSFNLCAEDGL